MIFQVRALVFTALFAALFVAQSYLTLPTVTLVSTSVPVTLQVLIVMLAAGFLGPLYGSASLLIVMALQYAGLPLMTGAVGLDRLTGPYAGYMWAFPLAALAIGFVANNVFKSGKPNASSTLLLFLSMIIFGVFGINALGSLWLTFKTDASFWTIYSGSYPFFLVDSMKAIIATLIVISLRPLNLTN